MRGWLLVVIFVFIFLMLLDLVADFGLISYLIYGQYEGVFRHFAPTAQPVR